MEYAIFYLIVAIFVFLTIREFDTMKSEDVGTGSEIIFSILWIFWLPLILVFILLALFNQVE